MQGVARHRAASSELRVNEKTLITTETGSMAIGAIGGGRGSKGKRAMGRVRRQPAKSKRTSLCGLAEELALQRLCLSGPTNEVSAFLFIY